MKSREPQGHTDKEPYHSDFCPSKIVKSCGSVWSGSPILKILEENNAFEAGDNGFIQYSKHNLFPIINY